MKYVQTAAIAAAVAFMIPPGAAAQDRSNGWAGRAFVTFNVGAQTQSADFDYAYATTLFSQPADAALKTPGRNGLSFDLGAGIRLVENLGVGVTFARYSEQRDATLTTTIPSPLYMFLGNDSSTVSRIVPLQREENAVHLQAIYRLPIGRRLQVGAFGGPSYFRCVDDHVTRFSLDGTFSELSYRWAVTFHDTTQAIDRGSAWGYHGGASVTYLAARHVGVGLVVRYSRASHTTANHFSDTTYLADDGVWGGDAGTATFSMRHGGLQWHGGLSFHF